MLINYQMITDNTPTVTARRRKPTRHMRLRMETAKKLRALGAAQRASGQTKKDDGKVTVKPVDQLQEAAPEKDVGIKTRAPRVKKAKLAEAPTPRAKFRKRQMNKTWLPTHMFHAKRARMTVPKEPLWRFAIPLTPTAKCYRPTHRAAHDRGAVAWDVSYISTIGLEGQQRSIEGLLTALRVDEALWTSKGGKWRGGSRVWEGFAFEREAPHAPIAPVTIIWCPASRESSETSELSKQKRKVFLRVHPSAFLQLWEEVLRLSKVAKPQVTVEDLRFEIGSIEMTGPGSTEALLGTLWPSPPTESAERLAGSAETTWTSLAGITDVSLLPPNVVLGLDVQDSRLHHPPRTIKLPTTNDEQMCLLELTAAWPLDCLSAPCSLFEKKARIAATSSLQSQKAINRRKSLAAPGKYPDARPTDPKIPTIAYSSWNGSRKPASWIVLLPWKAVQPIWYSIIYYPLSTGGQPRFGGLDEKRQLAFETGRPWFPGDFPGTKAGWEWEMQERKKREDEWRRRPKSKRINWDAVKLGDKKGEIGSGWACDWERLLQGPPENDDENTTAGASEDNEETATAIATAQTDSTASNEKPEAEAAESHTLPPKITYLPATQAANLLSSTPPTDNLPSNTIKTSLTTISLTCLTRGTPQTCARIYRLPSDPILRQTWLSLLHQPKNQNPKNSKSKSQPPILSKDLPPHIVHRRLAQALLEPMRAGARDAEGNETYPPVPDEEDLIGFVTTGNFNLAEGRGMAVGSILLGKVVGENGQRGGGQRRNDSESDEEGRICIVRNAGQEVGRLARWEVVG